MWCYVRKFEVLKDKMLVRLGKEALLAGSHWTNVQSNEMLVTVA